MTLIQGQLAPGASSWFLASLTVAVRFAAAAAAMLFWCSPTLFRLTRSELWHGVGLGLFGGLGVFFQADGLMHTAASTSAFLTQLNCFFVPLWVSFRVRTLPRPRIALGTALVLAGVAILSEFDWRELRVGRGEAETLLAALFFSGQILWLERRCFAGNRTSHFSLVMFGVIALMFLPLTLVTMPGSGALLAAYASKTVIGCTLIIVFGCTLLSYGLMNHWQPHVTATEAGLIYCTEPLFASVFALFLPGWLAAAGHVEYPNESLTGNLLIGGGLITAANVLIQIQPSRPKGPGSRQ